MHTSLSQRGNAMKILLAATMAVAMLTAPIHAQFHDITDKRSGGRIGPPPSGLKDSDRVDEKSYNAAVNRIPTDTQKPDPWRTVREKAQAK
jgi:hypothetical protein